MVRLPSFARRAEPARDENGDGRVDGAPVAGTTATEPAVTDRAGDQATYRSSTATLDRAAPADGSTSIKTESERKAAERGALARAATGRSTGRPSSGLTEPTAASDGTASTSAPNSVPTAAPTAVATGTTTRDTDPTRDTDTRVRESAPDSRPTQQRSPDLEPPVDTDRTRDDQSAEKSEPGPVVPAGPRPRASVLATVGLIVGVAAALMVLTGTLAGYGIGLGVLAVLLSVLGMSATRRRHVAGKSDALIGLLLGIGAVVVGILAMTGQFAWPNTDGDQVLRFREWLDSQFVDRF